MCGGVWTLVRDSGSKSPVPFSSFGNKKMLVYI